MRQSWVLLWMLLLAGFAQADVPAWEPPTVDDDAVRAVVRSNLFSREGPVRQRPQRTEPEREPEPEPEPDPLAQDMRPTDHPLPDTGPPLPAYRLMGISRLGQSHTAFFEGFEAGDILELVEGDRIEDVEITEITFDRVTCSRSSVSWQVVIGSTLSQGSTVVLSSPQSSPPSREETREPRRTSPQSDYGALSAEDRTRLAMLPSRVQMAISDLPMEIQARVARLPEEAIEMFNMMPPEFMAEAQSQLQGMSEEDWVEMEQMFDQMSPEDWEQQRQMIQQYYEYQSREGTTFEAIE